MEVKCKYCDKVVESYYSHLQLVEQQICFHCNYWLKMAQEDKNGLEYILTPEFVHYQLGDGGSLKGFAGRKWNIEMIDGKMVSTDDLWHHGTVPGYLRQFFNVNCKKIEAK